MPSIPGLPTTTHPLLKALAFDAYGTLFDVHAVAALAEQLFPGHGEAVSQLWRTKQLEYAWLRTMAGPEAYRSFWAVTEDALVHTARKLGLALAPAAREALMAQYLQLDPFPENLGVLRALRDMGLRLAILSNGDPAMLDALVASAGMSDMFEVLLSAGTVRRFKTAPEVYRLAVDYFGLSTPEIGFVSSNGWDAAGAARFGFTTFWVNRAGHPREELGAVPAGEGRTLADLVPFVQTCRRGASPDGTGLRPA